MKPVLEFFAVFSASVLNHIAGVFFYSKRSDYLKSFTVTENLLKYWASSMSAILVVLLVAIDQPDRFRSIGILDGKTNSAAILIGVFSVSVFIISLAGVLKIAQRFRKNSPDTKIDISHPAVVSVIQFRDAFELLAYLTTLPFVVISEDLVYRGYLVLMLGNKTHTFVPWAVLSVILSVIIHLYQGRDIRNMAYVAMFSAFFIGLAVATGNILAPIAAHLYYDSIWTIQTWRKIKNLEPQPEIAHSKKKRLAYSIFIGFNILLLSVSMQLFLYTG